MWSTPPYRTTIPWKHYVLSNNYFLNHLICKMLRLKDVVKHAHSVSNELFFFQEPIKKFLLDFSGYRISLQHIISTVPWCFTNRKLSFAIKCNRSDIVPRWWIKTNFMRYYKFIKIILPTFNFFPRIINHHAYKNLFP